MNEIDIDLGAGRLLHAYDTGEVGDTGELVVFWNHGTPNIGTPPVPLSSLSSRLGIRWLSFDRPGYGGSTPRPGRDVVSVATLAQQVADARGVDEFAVMGHSGGSPHALAVAAVLQGRVVGAVAMAGLAPIDAEGLDWFDGMIDSGVTSLAVAREGREAKARHEASAPEYDPEFTAADLETLAGEWAWLGEVVGPAVAGGPDGLIDDDIAYVTPWGFDPTEVVAPTLLIHGEQDRVVPPSHSEWMSGRLSMPERWLSADDGHVSILGSAPAALEWLRALA